MKGNKIEKLYTAQNYLYPNSYSQNNDNLTDIYFTNKDMFVVEETDQIWSENSFANREKVTIHGYKGSRLEAIALQLGYRFVELTECEINGHRTGLVEKAATCVSTGVAAHYECSVCNQLSSDKLGDYPVQADSLIVAIVKTNHTGKTEVKNTIAVTCAKEGYTGDTYCADCAEKIANGSVIEKIAHTLTHNEAVAATCTETGNVEHWQCNVCKVIFADKDAATVITTVTVPALGHDFGEGEAQDGVIVHKCLHCDATKSLKLPPAGMDVGMPAVSEKLQSSVMTESEKTRVQQGEKLDVYLEVSDISESVTEDDKEKVNEKLGNAKVGIYLDINLFKKVGNDRPAKVSEPGANVTISITVPLNLINTDALISREYQIIRIHNGVAEILKGVFDVNTNTFTFETDGFSTYVLTYQDTKLTTPATGDHADILLWTALITFSILSMTALVITKKRFF